MKYLWLGLLVTGLLSSLTGCQPSPRSDNWLLVSFEKDVPITYRMVSDRKTRIDLSDTQSKKKSRPQTMTEKLEMVLVYTPVEVDPFGLTLLQVDCQSAKVTRSGFSGKGVSATDIMETLAGKHFTLKLSPTGQIIDNTDLDRIAKELGNGVFSTDQNRRIKNPDMISDFLAMQQFLWDASATISNQMNLKVGDTWQADQIIAWPMPMYPPPARTTTYTLDSVTEEAPRTAAITSHYALSETPIETYIRPYAEGRFQSRGLFGFLRNYQFKQIDGSGKQVFNLDQGLVESDTQQYTLEVTASFMLPLGNSVPILTVNQTFSIDRLENPDSMGD